MDKLAQQYIHAWLFISLSTAVIISAFAPLIFGTERTVYRVGGTLLSSLLFWGFVAVKAYKARTTNL